MDRFSIDTTHNPLRYIDLPKLTEQKKTKLFECSSPNKKGENKKLQVIRSQTMECHVASRNIFFNCCYGFHKTLFRLN